MECKMSIFVEVSDKIKIRIFIVKGHIQDVLAQMIIVIFEIKIKSVRYFQNIEFSKAK